MTPVVMIAFLWLLFGGSHVGLAAVRQPLVARLGELGFVAVFYLVAAATFAALVTYYAAHRFEGASGLAMAGVPVIRWCLMGVAASGIVLMAPALANYPSLPSALFEPPIRAARGIEKITRHPFFAGMGLFALAHALLATHLIGTVFFGGLLLLVVIGARHQDRKLLARRGAPYAEYLAATSAIPFAALLSGRQRLFGGDLPIATLAIGVGLALVLRRWHEHLFAGGGAWIVAVFLVGALIAGLNALRRSRRPRAATPASSTSAAPEMPAIAARQRSAR